MTHGFGGRCYTVNIKEVVVSVYLGRYKESLKNLVVKDERIVKEKKE